MESRWHIPVGKILEETRIEDRKHALHITKENWSNITIHLDRNRLIAEAIEDEENKKKSMKEASDAMTKHWDNSVENLRKRKEEQRLLKFEAKEDKNTKRYLELKKMQAEERELYVNAMRDKISKKMDYPKSLHTALGVAEVVYENDRYLDLKQKIKEHFRKEEDKYAKKVKDDAAAAVLEDAERAKREMEKINKYSKALLQQIEDNRLQKQQLKDQMIADELDDYDRRAKERHQIVKYKHDRMMSNKKAGQRALKRNVDAQNAYRAKMKEEDRQLDVVISIIDKSKKKIACLKRNKEIDMMENRLKAAARVGKLAAADILKRQINEESILKKAIEEREIEYLEKLKIEKEKKERAKKDLIESHKEWQEREKERKCREQEIAKWEMLNRCKIVEEDAKQKEQLEKDRKDEMVLRHKELTEQMEQNKHRGVSKQAEKKKDYEDNLVKFKEEDEDFFKYANELLEYNKNRGRITYPIEKVIQNYKKNMLGQKLQSRACGNCKSLVGHKDIVNLNPGRMCHDPKSDPTYLKKMCKCVCHKDILFK